MRTPGKCVGLKGSRGFESLPLRISPCPAKIVFAENQPNPFFAGWEIWNIILTSMRKQSQRLFSARDRAYLRNRGIQAEKQLAQFRKGFPFVALSAPCTTGKGILKLSLEEQKIAEEKFLKEASKKEILKFVPASGAASRMFSFLEESKPEFADLKQKFLKRLPDFAFYSLLAGKLKRAGQDISKLRKSKKLEPVVMALLEKEGLGYRQAPKGMIFFPSPPKTAASLSCSVNAVRAPFG